MRAKTLMIQGTASTVGKSLLVAALCRIFAQDGYQVAPFKAQNMALNSYATRQGHEMGRAQVVQAQAAGLEPHVDMNPILLKPEADACCQVVVMGKPWATLGAGEYYQHKAKLWPIVVEALERLRSTYEIVVIEGAGSPAEINLREGDIVNMRVAKQAQAPVLLVGDIDRGGVFASLIGTLLLLEEDERELIKGFIINKFRGDVNLLLPGLRLLEERARVPVLGVVPYLHDLRIAQEDSVYLDAVPRRRRPGNALDIAVIHLPHTSNFDDFDPLAIEEGVAVRYVRAWDKLGEPDAIILPGTKTTIADLIFLRESGLAKAIVRLAQGGTPVVGICGGYQILGRAIADPNHVESKIDWVKGLGLLPIETIFEPVKATYQVRARVVAGHGPFACLQGQEVRGYEIHMGHSQGGEPILHIVQRGDKEVDVLDGAIDETGRIFGTYLHGLFDNANLRRAWLSSLKERDFLLDGLDMREVREAEYDRLADHVRANLDMECIYEILERGQLDR